MGRPGADVRARAKGCRALVLAVILARGLAGSNVVHAAPDPLDLVREGVSLRREGKDEEALERFRRAYEIDHGARALAQIGLAEQALGRWAPAYEHLTQALLAVSDRWIATNAATLRASYNEVSHHVGRLEIVGGSRGAEVRIDGVPRGQLPLDKPLVLPIGSVTITVARPGFVPVERVAFVRAQQTTRESFDDLARIPQASPSEKVADAPAHGQNAVPAVERPADSEPPRVTASADEGAISTARASAKWIAWGAAAAGLGVGILGYSEQSSAGNQFNNSCYYDQTNAIRLKIGAQGTVDQCRPLPGKVDTWFGVEVAGFVGAAALASLGVVFWLLEPTSSSTQTAWRACAPATAGGGTLSVGCRWEF